MILGLIPARGGSKRLPRKNLKMLCDRPLIEWTIDAAKSSAWLDVVAVTTEDDEIARVAIENGVSVIRRPMTMATDTASVYEAIKHALARMQGNFSHVCLLQPTSPLRSVADIDACCAMVMEPPQIMGAVSVDETTCPRPNGAVYVGRTDWLLAGGNFDVGPYAIYDMPVSRSIDINTESEFAEAERLMMAPA